jgi:hypothetical protein
MMGALRCKDGAARGDAITSRANERVAQQEKRVERVRGSSNVNIGNTTTSQGKVEALAACQEAAAQVANGRRRQRCVKRLQHFERS